MPRKTNSSKTPESSHLSVPAESIQRRIALVRGKRVMIDRDLADFYGVTTSALNRAVSRNPDRFPEDFAFRLTQEETGNLMFHFGASSRRSSKGSADPNAKRPHGGVRKPARVFTEQGVAMLASVLRSKQAASMSVAIVRAFVQLREMLVGHRQLASKLEQLEQRLEGHDEAIGNLFEAIRQLIDVGQLEHDRKFGFKP